MKTILVDAEPPARQFVTCPACGMVNMVGPTEPGRCLARGTSEACGTDLAGLPRRRGP